MTRLFLVRHGETKWNREARTQGSKDIMLTSKGIMQAQMVAKRLMQEGVDRIYSSDLKRAYHTAREIGDRLGLGVMTSPDFREMNFGCWEGKNIDYIKENYKDMYNQWITEPHMVHIPGGEHMDRVQQRALAGVLRIADENPGSKVVLVSHGVTIKTIVFGLLNINLVHARNVRLDNGGITIIDFTENGNVLVTMNDTCHLKGEYLYEE
jgi:broad specificity phosphatase PhoE